MRKTPVSAERARKGMMTEEQLGENIRDACLQLGWAFYWCRRLEHSSKGILDLPYLIPCQHIERRHILMRELKGHDARGRLGTATPEQTVAILLLTACGADAAIWTPADWYSGQILEELK